MSCHCKSSSNFVEGQQNCLRIYIIYSLSMIQLEVFINRNRGTQNISSQVKTILAWKDLLTIEFKTCVAFWDDYSMRRVILYL